MPQELWLRASDQESMDAGLVYLDLVTKGTDGDTVARNGSSINFWPPGTMIEKEPDEMFDQHQSNVLVFGVLEFDQTWQDHLQNCINEAGSGAKTSKNGRGDSQWHEWTSAQIPAVTGTFWMFKTNDQGGDRPHWVRQTWAI